MIKVYRTIPTYPIIKLSGGFTENVTIRGKFITDDEAVQKFIEGKGAFKRRWVFIDEKMTEAANEGVSESDINEVDDGADPDDVVEPTLGKVYAMSDLLKMKVPELRGILGKLGVKYTGLNKQQLISSILNGRRME